MTELVFILDRSGSMAELEADTIGGFNAMIEKQKHEPGPALVSTVLFSNESEVIHDRLPLDRVPPMTERECFPRGCTALLDAVGGEPPTNPPAVRTCRSGRCSSSQRTDWRTPAGAMIMRRCVG